MKVHFILMFFVIVHMSCEESHSCNYITDYFPLTSEARVMVQVGEYQKAYDLYTKAYDVCDPVRLINHNDLYNFAKCKSLLHKTDLSDTIIKALKQGITIETFLDDSDFSSFIYQKDSIKSEN